ncbi:BRO family protein [Serratia marcescens]|uniref:BRO-N domain-containing protein n=1 Tax=Serratia marcescens TaxID=615 RepID=UPI001F14F701|nr:BRO family protein [Serratia marcescens]MDP8610524.1 BRO family protein [Serratia marcescens]MDP8615655.1 BRO family protein [Serratia marcescens]MDP8645706.1 BRO family protein [Serratia marcescens]MDP8655649.1 BRO family protein [Serratia marcescens]MDP8660610.1 BRO family protein [Serratia marcescens]
MTAQLTFNSHVLETVSHDNRLWFTSATLAKALEYSRGDKITQIYNRSKDEFTPCMSINLKLKFNGLNNSLREKSVRVFSLRGAHLIAMLANTPVAKAFRKWVLDLIDREADVTTLPTKHQEQDSAKLPAGVYFQGGKYNPYRASATIDGKYIHLGVYPTVEDALLARHEYLRQHHVKTVMKNNADIVGLPNVNARILLTVENGQVTRSKIMQEDAITATPENLPEVLKEHGQTTLTVQHFQRIIEACVAAIAQKCNVPALVK